MLTHKGTATLATPRLLLRRGAADSPAEALCLVSREVEYAWENVDAMRVPFAAR